MTLVDTEKFEALRQALAVFDKAVLVTPQTPKAAFDATRTAIDACAAVMAAARELVKP